VVAVGRGGVRETVVDGETGLLVEGEGAADLAEALREDLARFDSAAISAHAQRFSAAAFRERFRGLVDHCRAEHEAAAA
jgi:glycosyltransferase involved in cell wall biosynthesis